MIHPIDTDYESAEREMLISLARPGDVLFDVGAYVGWYTVEFARLIPQGRVYAFEPILEIHAELTHNVSGLNNVAVYSLGLSDKRGIASFYVSEREPGTASLAPLEEDRFGPFSTKRRLATTIDHLCNDSSFPLPPPDLIKCDVEGAELMVLLGGRETITKHHPIIQCEMLRKWAKRFNYHPNDIIDFLAPLGYRCFALHDGKLDLFERMTDDTTERNFFFIHPDRP